MLQDCLCFFFFQAEDGIRDLVRSRGLGDVYKRQEVLGAAPLLPPGTRFIPIEGGNHAQFGWYGDQNGDNPVSYTHLTLPTSALV